MSLPLLRGRRERSRACFRSSMSKVLEENQRSGGCESALFERYYSAVGY